MSNIAESNHQVQRHLVQINIQTIHQDSRIASIVSLGNQDKLFPLYCVFIYPLSNTIYQRFASFIFNFQDRKPVSRGMEKNQQYTKGELLKAPYFKSCCVASLLHPSFTQPSVVTAQPNKYKAKKERQAIGAFGSIEGSSTITLAEDLDP